MANEVVKSFSETLTDKLITVENALPKDFNKERFVQNCLAVLNEKPELTKINPAELQAGLLKGAYLGLDFFNREFYLIPYGNKVNFQMDYKGVIKFVKRYSIRPILDIYARVVREGDSFLEKITNGIPSVDFAPKPFNNGEIVGAFAVVLYEDGCLDIETMTTRDINAVRSNYSKMCNSGAWKNSWDEMAKKTVLRRLCKHIETDFESVEAKGAWEDGSDSNIATVERSGDVVDAFSDVVAEAEYKEVE